MNSRTTSALALRGLTKTYAAGGSGERPALAPLTLDVAAGQLVALVGHNGSGKTTMLKTLPYEAGEVLVCKIHVEAKGQAFSAKLRAHHIQRGR